MDSCVSSPCPRICIRESREGARAKAVTPVSAKVPTETRRGDQKQYYDQHSAYDSPGRHSGVSERPQSIFLERTARMGVRRPRVRGASWPLLHAIHIAVCSRDIASARSGTSAGAGSALDSGPSCRCRSVFLYLRRLQSQPLRRV
eukprot:scaffold49_cov409-Prasinococcus_capsulatus_cf.AAC.4